MQPTSNPCLEYLLCVFVEFWEGSAGSAPPPLMDSIHTLSTCALLCRLAAAGLPSRWKWRIFHRTRNANAARSRLHSGTSSSLSAASLLPKSRGLLTRPPDTNKHRALWGSFSSPPPLLLASKARREHKGCSAERVSSSAPSVADFPSPPDQKDRFFLRTWLSS